MPLRRFLKDDRASDQTIVDLSEREHDEAFGGIRCPLCQFQRVTLKPVVLYLCRHSRAALRRLRYGVEHILDSRVLPGLRPSVALDVMSAMWPVVLTRKLVQNRKPAVITAVIFDLYETLVAQELGQTFRALVRWANRWTRCNRLSARMEAAAAAGAARRDDVSTGAGRGWQTVGCDDPG